MPWMPRRELRHCDPAASHRYHFGDGGDSTQTSATTTTTTTNVSDERAVADGGAIIARGSTVNVVDAGAIQANQRIAEAAIVGATKISTEARQAANQAIQRAMQTSKEAQDALAGAYEYSTKTLLWTAGAAALVLYIVLNSQATKRRA